MGMNIKVYNAEPPQKLIEIIHEDCNSMDAVNEVLIGKQMGIKAPGAFLPKEKKVIIDLDEVVRFNKFREDGMLVVASLWYMGMFVWWHELAHALELEDDPSLVDIEELPKEYENTADSFAMDCLLEWHKKNSITIPPMKEMGWIGKLIARGINIEYPKYHLEQDYELSKQGLIMNVCNIKNVEEHTEKQITTLIELIKSGDKTIGSEVAGDFYLTAESVFGAYANAIESNITAQIEAAQEISVAAE